ncbi:Gfo/Idh/MocA family protein [Marinactinospora thermotolerans]|uniref:Predicted dehydrogenase n=1 Tax=Marinactinospora thermotolerans DSM 45154 TaxID=1122192 RepID=A0A1T4JY96_9ACTN|nr:Gfo/Idh/MocA family oxidoreductase [Marinactinospora thermotolerans]SJZ35196.1 Predicted dehydrogenase [Marinactinospora thermotolerans DSM 45154]
MSGPVPVVLAGAHGHGRWHLDNLRRLAAAGRIRLVGVCDPVPVTRADLAGLGEPEQSTDLGELVRRTGAAVTVLVTPIHTHLDLARTALAAGSHVLLEKPPTATLAEYRLLRAEVARSGLACQVGFQSLGSDAPEAARALAASGAVGDILGVGAAGAWVRTSAYYARAPWAGRRRMDGVDVVDGALTNPFAHAVATALALAGAERSVAGGVELELFHAHEIDADDTSCLRLRAPGGYPVTVAVTLCARSRHDPYVSINGTRGRVRLYYTLDEVHLEIPGAGPRVSTHPRTDLLENLLDHLADGTPLLVPLERTEGFMTVLEAVRTAPDPRPIPATAQEVATGPDGVGRVVTGVEGLVARSAYTGRLFSELGVPWAASTTGARR